ncbi:hypothetical protein CFter6_4856 [Collimonas fungivorans]|uniref:Uncharacterized protein n=1 Tax=Collimonas fungivorans TaxID=158899 RepID=A0A127PI80_9BURK|nr:hypothetical protein CFter6_4856 [Collimonas fungivorans]
MEDSFIHSCHSSMQKSHHVDAKDEKRGFKRSLKRSFE